jgi:GNAT superfamily N-acetyltransferase/uncharacterized Zn finger protein (UPF0148 family)
VLRNYIWRGNSDPLGLAADVDAALSVYERSNLARRQGVWPNRADRVEQVRAHLGDPTSWFLVANDGPALVAMASAEALRDEDGAGPVRPGHCFLNLLFVLPERWGEGIGGVILDALLAEAKRRDYSRIHLWTDEDNERSHRLYRSRRFSPTGRIFCPRCKQDLLDARTSSPKDEEVAVHPRTAELPTTPQAERVWAKLREQLDRSDVEPPKDTVNHELWMKVQHFKRANPWATFEEVVAFREALLLERINERRDLEQEQELREQRGRRPRPPEGLGRPFGVFEPESVVW